MPWARRAVDGQAGRASRASQASRSSPSSHSRLSSSSRRASALAREERAGTAVRLATSPCSAEGGCASRGQTQAPPPRRRRSQKARARAASLLASLMATAIVAPSTATVQALAGSSCRWMMQSRLRRLSWRLPRRRRLQWLLRCLRRPGPRRAPYSVWSRGHAFGRASCSGALVRFPVFERASLNQLGASAARTKEYVLVDSGAYQHVCPLSFAPSAQCQPLGSQALREVCTASGDRVWRPGLSKQVDLKLSTGVVAHAKFEVLGISRPVLSLALRFSPRAAATW